MNKIEAKERIEKYLESEYNNFKDQLGKLNLNNNGSIEVSNFLSNCYNEEEAACLMLKSYCDENQTEIVSRFFGLKKEIVYTEFTLSEYKEFYKRNYNTVYLNKDHPLSDEDATKRHSKIRYRYQKSLTILKKIKLNEIGI